VIAFFTALGIGSIVVALISWVVAIANHRQNWINTLRDDISTFLKELETMHYAMGDLSSRSWDPLALEKAKREARVAVLFLYYRIVLRLNSTEDLHVELRSRLDALMDVTEKVPNREKIEEAVATARRVFKREWEVTKYGPLAPKIAHWKGREW
jgi:hypothetical protein